MTQTPAPLNAVTLAEVIAAIARADSALEVAKLSDSDNDWLSYRNAKNKAEDAALAYCRAQPAAPVAVGACCVPLPSEPSFVLLGRDPQAPALVRQWADDRERAEPGSNKPQKARDIAESMTSWKHANPGIGMASDLYAHPAPAAGGVDEAMVAYLDERIRLAGSCNISILRNALSSYTAANAASEGKAS